jgi:hypothetical protein
MRYLPVPESFRPPGRSRIVSKTNIRLDEALMVPVRAHGFEFFLGSEPR